MTKTKDTISFKNGNSRTSTKRVSGGLEFITYIEEYNNQIRQYSCEIYNYDGNISIILKLGAYEYYSIGPQEENTISGYYHEEEGGTVATGMRLCQRIVNTNGYVKISNKNTYSINGTIVRKIIVSNEY